jgi:hypothetical protein
MLTTEKLNISSTHYSSLSLMNNMKSTKIKHTAMNQTEQKNYFNKWVVFSFERVFQR